MSWSVGYDENWMRDVGYGVPATCDHPGCGKRIDRGLSHVCGGDMFGGERGCGLFFCAGHLSYGLDGGPCVQVCERCAEGGNDIKPFESTPDLAEWVEHKRTDPSWAAWRAEQPRFGALMASICITKLRKRHARYRRGREGVRPRHREKR